MVSGIEYLKLPVKPLSPSPSPSPIPSPSPSSSTSPSTSPSPSPSPGIMEGYIQRIYLGFSHSYYNNNYIYILYTGNNISYYTISSTILCHFVVVLYNSHKE